METLWLVLLTAMLSAYVILDGFDLGAGVVHLLCARSDADRRAIRTSIGPVWDGNEVWLIAAGGVLYFAFPPVYARAFSGFYLPLMIVLWLLIGRGVALELRHQVDHDLWRSLWDASFGWASLLLAVFFGAALGNVVRGVPFEADGTFFLPLWTDLTPWGAIGVIDGYTLLTGATALAALTLHGALWIVLKTEDELRDRVRAFARRCWWAVAALVAGLTAFTLAVQPRVWANLTAHPWGFAFPALAVAGLALARRALARDRELAGFLASCAFLAGMFAGAVFGIYPDLLPTTTAADDGLAVHDSATTPYGLRVGLAWFLPGMALAATYFVVVYRHFGGKVGDGSH